MERKISKKEFRALYVKYGQSQKDSGWTQDHWDHFYKNQRGVRYFFTEPTSPDENRMFINSGGNTERIFLLTTEAEESFFEPGWDDKKTIKRTKNTLKEYAEDDDDVFVNSMLKGFLDLNKKDYKQKKISKAKYLKEKKRIEKAIGSP